MTGDDPKSQYHPPAATPEQWARFDREAATGERIDPDNAYFPLMRAVGLFAVRRDAEATEAVCRASQKPAWREYLAEDVQNRRRLHAEAFGDPGAVPFALSFANTLLPEYQGMRHAALLVTYRAMQAEQSGHPQTGLALRETVRRCGHLMRVQSTTLIGAMVGSAFNAFAGLRPGGVPPIKDLDKAENRQAIAEAYAAYARQWGRDDIAQSVRKENAAASQISAVWESLSKTKGDLPDLVNLTRWWGAGTLILANLFWLGLLGTVAAASVRQGWLSAVPRFPPWRVLLRRLLILFAVGIWLVVLLIFVMILIDAAFLGGFDTFWRVGLALLVCLGLFGEAGRRFAATIPASEKKALVRLLGWLLLAGLGSYGFVRLLVWQTGGIGEIWGVPVIFDEGGQITDSTLQALVSAREWSMGSALLAPLLFLIMQVVPRLMRRPFWATVLPGFSAAALPWLSLLVLAYGVVVLGTVRRENAVSVHLQQSITSNGAYYAAQAGLPWPAR